MPIDFRPATDDDLDALHTLTLSQEAERGIPTTRTLDDTRREWFGYPRFDAATMSRLAIRDGHLVGLTGFEVHHEQLHSEGFVERGHRGQGIGAALVRWVVEQARARDGVETAWSYAPAERTDAHELFTNEGFDHVRSFISMIHRTPTTIAEPTWPASIERRTLDGEEACARAAEGWNLSFIDHWNFHPETADDYADRLLHRDEDTVLWTFAFEGDALAGFCITSIRKGEGFTRGYLGPIGTSRSHRGIGLGRALLRHGVRALAARGADEVRLGVDSENLSGAVRLYESNGFERDREGRAYRFDL